MGKSMVKAYLLTVFCGLAVLAVILLVILQWDKKSTFTWYGQEVRDVPTIWLVLVVAAASPVFILCCRGLGKGVWALYTARRAEAKAAKEIQAVVNQAANHKPQADEQQSPSGSNDAT